MKIPLNIGGNGAVSSRAAQAKVLEKDILAAQKGDWNAKNNIIRTFTPLITSLAEKRTQDLAEINRYIEAGKEGLLKAVRKYKPSVGADKFNIFAVDFIEKSLDRCQKGGGFWARLFGR